MEKYKETSKGWQISEKGNKYVMERAFIIGEMQKDEQEKSIC